MHTTWLLVKLELIKLGFSETEALCFTDYCMSKKDKGKIEINIREMITERLEQLRVSLISTNELK